MKRTFIIAALLCVLVPSCTKEGTEPVNSGEEICFSTSGLKLDVSTKATAITSESQLDSSVPFYACATKGTSGNETEAFAPKGVTKNGSSYRTMEYWPNATAYSANPYHFYASNVELFFNSNGCQVRPTASTTDIIVAYEESPTYLTNTSLNFHHIYARLGSITLRTQDGFQLGSVSGTASGLAGGGTYNIRTGSWISSNATTTVSLLPFSGDTAAKASSNDLYVVPSNIIEITLTYTLTKAGGFSATFTKSGLVSLAEGKINNIEAYAVGAVAEEIEFSVSVQDWVEAQVPVSVE